MELDYLYIGRNCAIIASEEFWCNHEKSKIKQIIPVYVFTRNGRKKAFVVIWENCILSKEEIFEDFKALNPNTEIQEINTEPETDDRSDES